MKIRKLFPILLILLLAFSLRACRLKDIPPGLTHDEANHGRDSINLLDGELLFYFPLNDGEPLYNYIVAGTMSLLGENLFTLRLVNVFFGLLAIGATFLWARRAFDRTTALAAGALMAVSFWPLVSSRQALRAGLLPFFITLAIVFLWRLLDDTTGRHTWDSPVLKPMHSGKEHEHSPQSRRFPWKIVFLIALAIAATIYTYLAARVLWLIFPLFLLYLFLIHRPVVRKSWQALVASFGFAGLIVTPMFAYIQTHPAATTRLQVLEGPLHQLASGNLSPILANVKGALLAFFWPGMGDQFLAYNIPGRPVLQVTSFVFMVLGIIVCLLKWRRPANLVVLMWFVIGIAPSLVTGAEANTTRNMGALPATYLLPAIGFTTVAQVTAQVWGQQARKWAPAFLVLWITLIAGRTVGDYFGVWAESADVRAAYQHTLTEELDYIKNNSLEGPIVVSTIYPGAVHDPSIAKVLLPVDKHELRWVDARNALLFPSGKPAYLMVPSSTSIHSELASLARKVETINIRQDDLDPFFTLMWLEPGEWEWTKMNTNFGDALTLIGANWSNESVRPGGTSELATYWRVDDPEKSGPLVLPAFETDISMFTHVIGENSSIIAQRDSLDAPSWAWQAGDTFIQIHSLAIPIETPHGQYEVAVGFYDRTSEVRLPVLDDLGVIVDTRAFVVPLAVYE